MPSPIIQLPKGLLGFLQMKGAAQIPTDLVEAVQPTLDLFRFYQQWTEVDQQTLAGGATSINIAAHGQGGFTTFPLTVPNNQVWYVSGYTIWANLLAADHIRLSPIMVAGNATIAVGPDANDIVSANPRTFACTSYGPFWAPSGAVLGWMVWDITQTVGITLNGAIRATPFLV